MYLVIIKICDYYQLHNIYTTGIELGGRLPHTNLQSITQDPSRYLKTFINHVVFWFLRKLTSFLLIGFQYIRRAPVPTEAADYWQEQNLCKGYSNYLGQIPTIGLLDGIQVLCIDMFSKVKPFCRASLLKSVGVC